MIYTEIEERCKG